MIVCTQLFDYKIAARNQLNSSKLATGARKSVIPDLASIRSLDRDRLHAWEIACAKLLRIRTIYSTISPHPPPTPAFGSLFSFYRKKTLFFASWIFTPRWKYGECPAIFCRRTCVKSRGHPLAEPRLSFSLSFLPLLLSAKRWINSISGLRIHVFHRSVHLKSHRSSYKG